MSEEDGLLPEQKDNQNTVNPVEENQIEDHQVEGNHGKDTQTEDEEAQDTYTKGVEGTTNSEDETVSQKASVQETITGTAHQEVLKTYIPIQRLIWNDADTLISYMEEDVVHLVDSTSHAIVGAVEFPGVLDYSMFMEEDGVIHVIAGSADGTIAAWNIPYKPSEEVQLTQEFEPHFMNSVPEERGVDLLAFSDDSNYIAEFYEATGELGLHYKLRYTNELISKKAAVSVSNVYSMAFSDDNNQLATATQDGKLFIWNAFNGRFMYERDIYTKSRVPVHFIQGTYNLLVASAEHTVVVLDPGGSVLQSITTSSPVVDTKMLSDKRRVAILTQDNRIEIYNLEDGMYLGYVPSFNVTAITSFDFNSTDTSMVVGHEDGSIYKIDLETNVLPPRTRPVLRLIGGEEVVAEGDAFTPEIPPAEYSDTMPVVRPISDWLGDSTDGLYVEGKLKMLNPYPYSIGFGGGVSWHIGSLLNPLYFGIGLDVGYALWRSDFPYIYTVGTTKYNPPGLYTFSLYVPFGISFHLTQDIMVATETKLGVHLLTLMNLSIPHMIKPYPALLSGIAIRCTLWNWCIAVGVDYDGIQGFIPVLQVGYKFKLPSLGSGKLFWENDTDE